MVTIIKEGLYGKVRFNCERCECVFEADENECGEDWSRYDIPWTHKCPKCKTLCYSTTGMKKDK